MGGASVLKGSHCPDHTAEQCRKESGEGRIDLFGRKNCIYLDTNFVHLKALPQTLATITCFFSTHVLKHFYTCILCYTCIMESDMLEQSTMNMFSVKSTACHMFTVYMYMYNYTAKVCTRHSHTVHT